MAPMSQDELIIPDSTARRFSSRGLAGDLELELDIVPVRLLDHPHVEIVNRRGDGRIVEAWVPLKLIYAEGVPVEAGHVLELADSMQALTPEGRPRGQVEPITLAEVPGFPQFPILNGFHRAAALELIVEREVKEADVTYPKKILGLKASAKAFATIETNLSWEQVADARIEAAALQKSVRFARLIEWVDEAWQNTSYAQRGIQVYRAFQLRFASATAGDSDGLTPKQIEEMRTWVDRKCKLWGLAATTIYQHLKVAQVADPTLIKEARGRTSGHRLDAPTPQHLSVICKGLPNQHDLQRLIVDTAIAQTLTVQYTKALVAAVVDVTRIEEAKRIIDEGSWKETADPYPPAITILRSTKEPTQEDFVSNINIKHHAEALVRMGYANNLSEAESIVKACLRLFEAFPVLERKHAEIIHNEGEPSNNIVLLRGGTLIVCNTNYNSGERVIIELVDPFAVLGDEIFSGSKEYKHCVEAFGDCKVQTIHIRDLSALVKQDSRMAPFLLVAQSIRMRGRDKHMQEWGTKDATQRIAGSLLEITSRLDRLPLRYITHQFVAELSACARQTTTRILDQFVSQGIIYWERSIGPQLVNKELLHEIYSQSNS